jgi:hypothetical protein
MVTRAIPSTRRVKRFTLGSLALGTTRTISWCSKQVGRTGRLSEFFREVGLDPRPKLGLWVELIVRGQPRTPVWGRIWLPVVSWTSRETKWSLFPRQLRTTLKQLRFTSRLQLVNMGVKLQRVGRIQLVLVDLIVRIQRAWRSCWLLRKLKN